MPSYTIDSQASRLVVTARSRVHNTDVTWSGVTGTIEVDADKLESTSAQVAVDMTTADAGDWLKNRKMRKDMDFDKNPKATMSIASLSEVKRDGDQVSASLHGKLQWRGKEIDLVVQGKGSLDDSELRVRGEFEINLPQLGITPPKVLMIKIDDVVGCQVQIIARVG